MILNKIRKISIINNGISYLEGNLKDSVFSLSTFAVRILDSFILNIFLVRYLSVSDLGNYKLFFSILNILIIFSINGLNTSIVKSVVKKYNVFFIKATKISLSFSTLASLALITLSLTLYKNASIKYILIYSSILIPIFFGLNTWESFLLGKKNFKKIFIINILIISTKLTACIIVLVFYQNYNIVILAILASISIYNIFLFFLTTKELKGMKFNPDEDKKLIKHGSKITAASIVSIMAKNIERIILFSVSSSTLVGVYSIANIIPMFTKNGLKALISVPTVKLASKTEAENRRVIKKNFILIFLSGIIILLILWFISPLLLRLVFGVTDPITIRYSQLLLLPIIFIPMNLVITYMCSYQGGGGNYLKLTSAISIIKIILLSVFIPFLKIDGIIIAVILSEFISFLILIIWFLKTNKRFNTTKT